MLLEFCELTQTLEVTSKLYIIEDIIHDIKIQPTWIIFALLPFSDKGVTTYMIYLIIQ